MNIQFVFNFFYRRSLPELAAIAVLWLALWTAGAVICRKTHMDRLWKALNVCGAALVMICSLYFTVIGRSYNKSDFILIPFRSFQLARGHYDILQQIVLNVFLFVPIGLTVPFALPDRVRRRAGTAIGAAVAFSVLIEALQFAFQRGYCEIDDVLANTLGASVGVLSYLLYRGIEKRMDGSSERK